MKQHSFEAQHEETWARIEASLQKPSKDNNSRVLAEHYMQLCQHLAIAKERLYDAALVERLNNLVLAVYRELYRYRSETRLNLFAFFRRDFPLAIYRQRYFVLTALLVFVLPGLLAGAWTYFDDEALYSMVDAHQVRQVERMYDPEARVLGREREADTDIYMFGFYIKNNMFIGGIAGHLTRLDYVDTFYPFVVGHGSFELTAIVFSGAAGLRLGYSIINPGPFSRLDSLRLAAREVVPMIYGTVLMLVIAAFLEAFWSSSTLLSSTTKYAVGAGLWALVLLYSFSGGRHEPR